MQERRMLLQQEHHLILPFTSTVSPGKRLLVYGDTPAGSSWPASPGHARYLHDPYSRVRRRRR
jgi:hypothetical protein